MLVVDSHLHLWPREFFDVLSKQSEFFPHVEISGGSYIYHGKDHSYKVDDKWIDLDIQFEDMDATGHDVIAIGTGGTKCSDICELPASLGIEAAQAFNEGLSKVQRTSGGRFFGTAVLPLQDMDASLRMLDAAADSLDLCAVNLPPTVGTKQIDTDEMEPFYARVAAKGLPLILHASDTMFGHLLMEEHGGALQLGAGRMFESSIAALRLIVSGAMERHPTLRIIHQHVGGTLPYISGRLDKNARRPGLQLPSVYLKRMYTDTVAPHLHSLKLGYEFYGPDHLMYGTDYPCWSPAAAMKVVEDLQLPDDVADRVFRRNAAEIFGIDLVGRCRKGKAAKSTELISELL